MTKILFHSLTIPPDKVSTGMLVAEIASGFKDRGVDVEILASTPQYNFDSNINNKVEFKRISRTFSESSYKDVRVIHINSKKRSYSDSKRILQWFRFHYHSIKYLFKNRSEYSHIFLFSYPPTMNLVGIFISKFLKIKLIYSYWELYPEIAEQIERVKNKLLLSLFKSIDTYALNNADSVVLNSKELEGYMKNERLVENNLTTINHFSPFPYLKELPKKSLKSIFYAGNIGKPQNIPFFIDYFNKSLSSEWTLNIYGSGEEYDHVKSLENEKVLVNEYIDRSKLIELTADIPFALVSLDPNLTIEGFPGKTFDYLSMNKIILCFANDNSAVARFIEENEVGINIDPENLQNLDYIIKKLNSPEFIEKSLNNVINLNKNQINKEKVIDKYLSLI